jgi:hypothetical protein
MTRRSPPKPLVEQGFGELESAKDRGARGAPVGRARNLIGHRFCRCRTVDQPPGQDDLLIVETGLEKMRSCVLPPPVRMNSREPGDIALTLQLCSPGPSIGHVDDHSSISTGCEVYRRLGVGGSCGAIGDHQLTAGGKHNHEKRHT